MNHSEKTFEFDPLAFTNGNASDLLEEAFEKYDHIVVPELDCPVMLNRPIVLSSGKHLTVHPKTAIRMQDGCGGCMVRNAHPFDGRQTHSPETYQDHDICVEGGIWEYANQGISPYDNNPVMQAFGENKFFLVDGDGNVTDPCGHEGSGGISLGALFFSNTEQLTIRQTIVRQNSFFGIYIAGCRNFTIEDIIFDDNKSDGIHINGPSSYGTIQRICGTTRDDLLALNAWDWSLSAVSFGPIHHICADTLSCRSSELRLLPGRKTYQDGTQVECPIYDCTLNNIEGVYCYKLYQQPNCTNEMTGLNDKSDIPGRMERISFSNIRVNRIGGIGAGEIPVAAVFEVCSDCQDLQIKNVSLQTEQESFVANDMKVVKVGPKSSTWKRGYTDPKHWVELFDTELICTADGITFQNICFNGKVCNDETVLIGQTKLTPNLDYPNTTPRGGNGYGIVKNVVVEV